MIPLKFSECSAPGNLFVARREGGRNRTGAILVINNHDSVKLQTKVDTKVYGYSDWKGEELVNLLNPSDRTNVAEGGTVILSAPPRGVSIYIPVNESNHN